jgi:hypothetical protein
MGVPAGTIITPQMLSAAGIIPASLVASMLQNAGMTGAPRRNSLRCACC